MKRTDIQIFGVYISKAADRVSFAGTTETLARMKEYATFIGEQFDESDIQDDTVTPDETRGLMCAKECSHLLSLAPETEDDANEITLCLNANLAYILRGSNLFNGTVYGLIVSDDNRELVVQPYTSKKKYNDAVKELVQNGVAMGRLDVSKGMEPFGL